MSKTDYIRAAVDLADGWRVFGGMDIEGWDYIAPHQQDDKRLSEITQVDLDTLAAQLVRQVDALDGFFVDSDEYGTAKVWAKESGLGMGRIAKSNDGDKGRTMNTIKAIVDSKVLAEKGL